MSQPPPPPAYNAPHGHNSPPPGRGRNMPNLAPHPRGGGGGGGGGGGSGHYDPNSGSGNSYQSYPNTGNPPPPGGSGYQGPPPGQAPFSHHASQPHGNHGNHGGGGGGGWGGGYNANNYGPPGYSRGGGGPSHHGGGNYPPPPSGPSYTNPGYNNGSGYGGGPHHGGSYNGPPSNNFPTHFSGTPPPGQYQSGHHSHHNSHHHGPPHTAPPHQHHHHHHHHHHPHHQQQNYPNPHQHHHSHHAGGVGHRGPPQDAPYPGPGYHGGPGAGGAGPARGPPPGVGPGPGPHAPAPKQSTPPSQPALPSPSNAASTTLSGAAAPWAPKRQNSAVSVVDPKTNRSVELSTEREDSSALTSGGASSEAAVERDSPPKDAPPHSPTEASDEYQPVPPPPRPDYEFEEEEEEEGAAFIGEIKAVDTSGVYGFEKMRDCRRNAPKATEKMQEFAVMLFSRAGIAMPDAKGESSGFGGPLDFRREGFGFDVKPSRPFLRPKELHDKVRHCLNLVTPEKYNNLLQELLDLPLRQAEDEEIKKCVEVFFKKAVQEPQYSDLYAKMVHAIVHQQCTTEEVAKKLKTRVRSALLNRCQDYFEKRGQDRVVDVVEGAELTAEQQVERDQKNELNKKLLNGNLKFVGELAKLKLMKLSTVATILYHLMYGAEEKATKYKAEEYELEMVTTLLKTLGVNLAQSEEERVKAVLDHVVKTCDFLAKNHATPRIRFLMMGVAELAERGWEPKKVSGPLSMEELQRSKYDEEQKRQQAIDKQIQQNVTSPTKGPRFGSGRGSFGDRRGQAPSHLTKHPSPTPSPPPQEVVSPSDAGGKPRSPVVPTPTSATATLEEQVRKAMTDLQSSGDFAQAAAYFRPLSESQRLQHIKKWLNTVVLSARLAVPREQIGKLLGILIEEGLFTRAKLKNTVLNTINQIVEENQYENSPKAWKGWAEVVAGGCGVLTPDAHGFVLAALVDNGAPASQVGVFLNDVLTKLGESALHIEVEPDGTTPRFRFLPALLTAPEAPPGETLDVDEDVMAAAKEKKIVVEDTEFKLYGMLVPTLPTPTEFNGMFQAEQTKDPEKELGVIMKSICAIYCYAAKFGSDKTTKYAKTMRTVVEGCLPREKPRREQAILMECYGCWVAMHREPGDFLKTFVNFLSRTHIVTKEAVRATRQAIANMDHDKAVTDADNFEL